MRTPGTNRMPVWFLTLAIWLHSFNVTQAQTAGVLKKIGFDQHLNEQVPLDLEFTDDLGNVVRLGEYFGEKPVILILAYYKCPMLCTLVLNGLTQAMRELPFTVGKEFNVVVVSFNPHETPDLAAAKKKNYVRSYGKPDSATGWHFLVGKQESIEKLCNAVGFRYVYDAKTDQYLHTSGIMVLTPKGKISRYFYGISYPSRDLRLGLVEASADKIGSPADQILLYCFHYDPESGKYTASILNYVRAGGVMTFVMIIGMVWFLLRTESKRRVKGAIETPVFTTNTAREPEEEDRGGHA